MGETRASRCLRIQNVHHHTIVIMHLDALPVSIRVGELDSVCRIKEVLGEVALNYKASCSRFLGKNGHKFEKKCVTPVQSNRLHYHYHTVAIAPSTISKTATFTVAARCFTPIPMSSGSRCLTRA